VERLDVGTEGLLILTNDGNFAQRVSHPRYEVPRVYQAKVRDVPSHETLARLTAGVRVEGERLAADHVRVLEADNNSWLELTLHEGKNHEVRRLMEAVGHPVSKLKRVAIGPVTTRGLSPGQFRHLTPQEVRALTHGVRPAARPRVPGQRETRGHGRGFGPASAPLSASRSRGSRPFGGERPNARPPAGRPPFAPPGRGRFEGQRPPAGRRTPPPMRSDEGIAGLGGRRPPAPATGRRPPRPAPGRPPRRLRRPPR